jgi:hypothetical protein
MNLGPIASRGQSPASGGKVAGPPNPERFLTLVVEGAALGVPEVDSTLYKEFREQLARLALQLPDRLPDEDKLAQIRTVLREFENYRNRSEAELRDRTTEWRSLVSILFTELLKSLGMDPSAASPERLMYKIKGVTSAADIADYRHLMELFLHPAGSSSAPPTTPPPTTTPPACAAAAPLSNISSALWKAEAKASSPFSVSVASI